MQTIFRNTYVYTYMHVTTANLKKGHESEREHGMIGSSVRRNHSQLVGPNAFEGSNDPFTGVAYYHQQTQIFILQFIIAPKLQL